MDHSDATDDVPISARRAPATIYDIARVTGVSPSTVSRALSRPGRISAKTEQRIRDAAVDLGYRANPLARALPTGRTRTLALLLSDITNPVFFDLVRGAERVAADEGYTLVLAESQESADQEMESAVRLQASVDGIVLVASRLDDEQIIELVDVKPLVAVNRRIPGTADLVPEVEPGVEAALDHLQHLGHRSLGFLAGPTASWMSGYRWEVLFDRAVSRGLSIVEIGPGSPTVAGGAALLPRVLASGVTAVLTYNDLMAMGLIKACHEQAVDIPGRLSVVGFDDIFGADLITPALTTIRSPLRAMGESSIRMLLGEISGEVVTDPERLSTEFVARASTGHPAGAA